MNAELKFLILTLASCLLFVGILFFVLRGRSLPPKVFAMTWSETIRYIVLAFLSAPAIHVLFSFFLGWKEYMPFLPVPSLWKLSASG